MDGLHRFSPVGECERIIYSVVFGEFTRQDSEDQATYCEAERKEC